MIIKTITAILVPLVSYSVYKLGDKPDFVSASCFLLNSGCPQNIPIEGYCDSDYQKVYDVFLKSFELGYEVGAGVSAYVDGKQVVSLRGGWKDPVIKEPYTNDTLQMVYSSTKFLSALVVAQLVDEGVLSYEERIATYWPEFAQGNKSDVTLKDLLQHRSGVGALDHQITYEDLEDCARLSEILARQTHNFEGLPKRAYHAITQGWYLNEIIRRADPQHRTIDDFAKEYKNQWGSEWHLKPGSEPDIDMNRISPFYKKSDFYYLLSTITKPSKFKQFVLFYLDQKNLIKRSFYNAYVRHPSEMTGQAPRDKKIENPALSGHTNADSMAKIAALFANKGKSIVQGEPDLFKKNTSFEIMTEHREPEIDQLMNNNALSQYGGLLEIPFSAFDIHDEEGFFEGGGGAGGSIMIYNTKYNIAIAYAMNGYSTMTPPDHRTIPLMTVTRAQRKKLENTVNVEPGQEKNNKKDQKKDGNKKEIKKAASKQTVTDPKETPQKDNKKTNIVKERKIEQEESESESDSSSSSSESESEFEEEDLEDLLNKAQAAFASNQPNLPLEKKVAEIPSKLSKMNTGISGDLYFKTTPDNRSKLVSEAVELVEIGNKTNRNAALSVKQDDSKLEHKPSRKERQQERAKTAGGDWFDMPRPEITPEMKRDLQVLKMRHVLDRKRHYKKMGKQADPTYFQVGRIVQGPTEFFSARMTRKERKETIVDELLASEEQKQYYKRKHEQVSSNAKSGGKRDFKKLKAQRRTKH